MPDRPNLLFVFADQLRAREIDDPRHPLITPAYDRLREEGTRCVNTVSNCPVCTPARAMLLTGQYPLANRVTVNDVPLPEDSVTIGSVLKSAGYRTGYVGKWHLDGVPRGKFTPPGPRRHGFDTWAVHNCIHSYLQSSYYADTPELLRIPGYEPEFQTDLGCDFLRQQSEDPFCLFLSWGPPHNPYELVPDWYQRLYPPERVELPASFESGELDLVRFGKPAYWAPPAEARRRNLAQYYAHITALDQQLMRLLDTLDATGQAENTLVIYTSDHGDMLWNHGRCRKQQPWDESVRIPFVARLPGVLGAGLDRRGCFSIADMAPSVLAILGLEVPDCMEGDDLSAMLRGAGAGPRSSLLLDLYPMDEGHAMGMVEWRGVRTERHTYARTREERCWLLYDNLADPDQLTNLADVPGHEALKAELEAELQGWLERTGDPFEAGGDMLRRLGLQALWNARERELHGDRGRFLKES